MGPRSSQGATLVGATREPHSGRGIALSTAYGYCVGLITSASMAGAVYSQLAVRSTQFGGVLSSLPGLFTACGTRCVFYLLYTVLNVLPHISAGEETRWSRMRAAEQRGVVWR